MKAIVYTLVFALLAASATAFTVGPSVYVDPATQTVDIGDTPTADVMLTGGLDVFGFEFKLSYDDAVLTYNGIVPGTFLTTPMCFGPTALPGGDYIYSCTNGLLPMFPGLSGSGQLAQIMFTGAAAGTSDVDLYDVKIISVMPPLPPLPGAPLGLLIPIPLPIDVVPTDGEIVVEDPTQPGGDIPEFTTIGAGLALLGAGLIVWRKRK